jgi:hypothetical protein
MHISPYHTHSLPLTHALFHTHTHSIFLSRTLSLTDALSLSLSLTLFFTHTHSLFLSHSLPFTHAFFHKHALYLSLSHTLSLTPHRHTHTLFSKLRKSKVFFPLSVEKKLKLREPPCTLNPDSKNSEDQSNKFFTNLVKS